MNTFPNRLSAVLLAGTLAASLFACAEKNAPAQEPVAVPSSVSQAAPPKDPGTAPQASRATSAFESHAAEEAAAYSATEAPPASVSAAHAPDAPANPFALDPAGDYLLYAYDATRLGYVYWGCAAQDSFATLQNAIRAINTLPALDVSESAPSTAPEYGLMRVAPGQNYEKTQFYLHEGLLSVDGTPYEIDDEQYAALQTVLAAGTQDGQAVPQWFVYMNPNRVTCVQCSDVQGSLLEMPADTIPDAAAELLQVYVENGKTYAAGSRTFDDSYFRAVYTFDNGVTYRVCVSEDGAMYVESSDMVYGCEYTLTRAGKSRYTKAMRKLLEAAPQEQTQSNPLTGKPVLYLYPQQPTDVRVALDFAGTLTYTYPDYRDGWQVSACPDGTLTDKADGSTHYYLFWEGTADRYAWDFSTGFVVPGAQAGEFLREKLVLLGLTPREYNDFITYWAPELSRNRYNLVTFATTQYEAIAKLQVEPKPDTVLRVHMVYKAIDGPVAIPEQVLPKPPPRRGFTVVEWGGTRA